MNNEPVTELSEDELVDPKGNHYRRLVELWRDPDDRGSYILHYQIYTTVDKTTKPYKEKYVTYKQKVSSDFAEFLEEIGETLEMRFPDAWW